MGDGPPPKKKKKKKKKKKIRIGKKMEIASIETTIAIHAANLNGRFPPHGAMVTELSRDAMSRSRPQPPYTSDTGPRICSVFYVKSSSGWFGVSLVTLVAKFGPRYLANPRNAQVWLVQHAHADPAAVMTPLASLSALNALIGTHNCWRLVVSALAETNPSVAGCLPPWEAAQSKMRRMNRLINLRPSASQKHTPAPSSLTDVLKKHITPMVTSPINSLWDLITSGQIAIAAFLLLRGTANTSCVVEKFKDMWIAYMKTRLVGAAILIANQLIPVSVRDEIESLLLPTKNVRCLVYAVAVLAQTSTGGMYTPAILEVLGITEAECSGAVEAGRAYTAPTDAIGLAVRVTLMYRDGHAILSGVRSAVAGLYQEIGVTPRPAGDEEQWVKRHEGFVREHGNGNGNGKDAFDSVPDEDARHWFRYLTERDAKVSWALSHHESLASIRGLQDRFTTTLSAAGYESGPSSPLSYLKSWCPALFARLSVYSALVATGYTADASANAVFELYMRMEAPLMWAAYAACT